MIDPVEQTAARCRHYAMCKIDFLGTGLCPSGPRKGYVAYYPQGRMDILDALAKGNVPVSEGLVDIADTCTLCGICDKQCHFVTGMRPVSVMRALKNRIQAHLDAGKPVLRPAEDEVLKELRGIVGQEWATNDPAIAIAYANDPYPLKDACPPAYVVLPNSAEEVAAIVKLAAEKEIPYAVRGNGGSVFGMVFSEGIVLDMNRMKEIQIDAANWTATVGAGVTAFELQEAAGQHGLRINAAEPAATVCGNVICTGLFSPWSAAYGTFADNLVDMEFVGKDGRIFCLSDSDAPNLYAYEHKIAQIPGVCTRGMIRLYPTTDDEESLLVPFPSLEEAIRFAHELSVRRIGVALAVIGPHYVATFISPSQELAAQLKEELGNVLGFEYAVLVVADAYGRDAIQKMAPAVIDHDLLRKLLLGLPRLLDPEWLDLIRGYQGEALPYELFGRPEMAPLLDAFLQPSPETAASAADADLYAFYQSLYERPQFTDMVWLTSRRVLSTRMARHKHVLAFLIYVPGDRPDFIAHMNAEFQRMGDALGIDNAYGFLTPMDMGKRAIFEYDYYVDHTDPEDKERAGAAMAQIVPWLDELALTEMGVTWIMTFFSQGCARKEHIFYHGLRGRPGWRGDAAG